MQEYVMNPGNAPHSPSITVYTPESNLRRPQQMVRSMFADLRLARELAWRLAVRDINAQYRQTALGFLWAIILPLATTVTWLFLNASGIISMSATTIPYPVYVFTGTMLWSIFMDSLTAPLAQTTGAKAMLTKLNFPREALILSGIYQTLFNAGIKIALLVVVVAVAGVSPGWGLALLPLGILSLLLAGTAIGLTLTPVGMLYTDIGKGLPLVLQFCMYITPVVFPLPQSGWALTLFKMNPMTPIIMTARSWITGVPADFLTGFVWVNAGLLIIAAAAWIMYRLAMPILIERISS
jgi:lipopolysaccharide transport system permease protein